jgi:hypothetical protein
VEKTSQKNSLKLTETLSELEAALQAWDRGDHDAESPSANDTAADEAPRKRAQELLKQLKEQLSQLSTDDLEL